jgi:hypothetical protein
MGLAANAPQTNATVLFKDRLLTDGQETPSNQEFFSTKKALIHKSSQDRVGNNPDQLGLVWVIVAK